MAQQQTSGGKTAIILEGGSFRGVFTAGVLDILLEDGIAFDACFGVSAGALCGMSFKSRQIGRTCRINLAFCNDSRYIGARAAVTERSVIGYDFLLGEVQEKLDPLDYDAYLSNPMPLYVAVTDLTFGTADFLEVANPELDIACVQASTSLPLITQPVEIEGHLYMDGGLADSVPVEHVLEHAGFDRAVVVLTRERGFEKQPYGFMPAARRAYADYPYFLDALATRHERYNEQREHIWAYEEGGRALVLAPEAPVEVDQIERNAPKLLDLYLQGRRVATRQLEAVRAFARND